MGDSTIDYPLEDGFGYLEIRVFVMEERIQNYLVPYKAEWRLELLLDRSAVDHPARGIHVADDERFDTFHWLSFVLVVFPCFSCFGTTPSMLCLISGH